MSPRRRLPSVRAWFWLAIAILLGVRWLTLAPVSGQRDFSVAPLEEGSCRVVRVVEADRLIVVQDESRGEVTIKLLSTQAPQTADGAKLIDEARRFTESFVQRGEARLVLDNHRLDTKGNYLAYVECGGAQLNEALLSAGLARFFYFPGNSPSMDRRLKAAEDGAKEAKLGLWAE